MTELESIAYFVNEGESVGLTNPSKTDELYSNDVILIKKLGPPTEQHVDYMIRAFAHARKRLIVSGLSSMAEWQKYFNALDVVCMDVDETTVILDKEL